MTATRAVAVPTDLTCTSVIASSSSSLLSFSSCPLRTLTFFVYFIFLCNWGKRRTPPCRIIFIFILHTYTAVLAYHTHRVGTGMSNANPRSRFHCCSFMVTATAFICRPLLPALQLMICSIPAWWGCERVLRVVSHIAVRPGIITSTPPPRSPSPNHVSQRPARVRAALPVRFASSTSSLKRCGLSSMWMAPTHTLVRQQH